MPKFLKFIASARKALVAAAGGLAEIVTLNLLHGSALHWALSILAGLTIAGVYNVPNAPAKP